MQNKKGEKKSKKRFLSGTNRLIERSKFHIKKMALWVYTRPWKKGRKSWTSRRQKISKDIPLEKTFLQLFTRQVNVCGDRIAVTGKGQFSNGNILHLTYRVLHEKSDLLACFLSNKKVRPDTITGIIMERSIEMITCLLAVWKAGGAYLPIEPEYPQERIDFMLKDSNAKILINKSEIRNPKLETNPNKTNSNDQNKKQLFETVSVLNFEHLNLNSIKGCPRRGFSNFVLRASDLNSSNLAYIIYTSGSTGRPKGVLVDHGNVAAYLHAFTREFKFTPGDIILQQASYTFDTFVEEVYGALIAGSKIAIADNRTTRDIDLLSEFIEKFNITVMDCVPLLLNELNKSCAAAHERRRLRSIHTFISGGDVLKYRHIDNLLKTGKVYNTYGPSETTVCASYYRCPMRNTFQVHSAISIGKAITGYDIFIINPNGDPDAGEQLLRYVADVGDDGRLDTGPCLDPNNNRNNTTKVDPDGRGDDAAFCVQNR